MTTKLERLHETISQVVANLAIIYFCNKCSVIATKRAFMQ